jgi:predicted permease
MTRGLQDLAFAVRALAQRPMYAGIIVLVLALAIGANATVFSVFNGFFIKPLPYAEDERLVFVYNTYPLMNLEVAGSSIPDYLDRREQAPSLESLALFNSVQRTLGIGDRPEQVTLVRTTPSLFEVFGVAPLHGRVFGEDEATPGNDRFVVLGHEAWATRFGADPGVVGSDIRLDGEPYTVLGVMPPRVGDPTRIGWVPFAFTPEQMSDDERGNEYSVSIGRLTPGATIEGLRAELDTIVQRNVDRIAPAQPGVRAFIESSGFTGTARDLREYMVGDLRQMLVILQAVVAAVLLIACANVANLQLARTLARRKELAVRAVLGAGRARLARLVVFESLLLAAIGAAVGLVLAYGGLELVRTLGLDRAHQGFEFVLDLRVIAVTIGATLLAALLSALLPVLALWRADPGRTIHDAGRLGGDAAAHGVRNTLVVVQVAMSVALLVGAGLLTKSFYNLQAVGTGFNAENVLTARVTLPMSRYGEAETRLAYYTQALEEFAALPGVERAAYVSTLPFSGGNSQGSYTIDGYTPGEGEASPHAQQRVITVDYFATMDIPVIQGRNFNATEADPVAIIDENLAARYFPDGDALGNRVRRGSSEDWYTIIGVVPAVKHGSLTDPGTKETMYWHLSQRTFNSGVFVMRTAVSPEQLTRTVGDAALALDAEVPLYDIKPLMTRVEDSLGPQRTPMVLSAVFAVVAVSLAVIGIYGVLTWAVTQRYGEIGVRLALGAGRGDIVRMVVGQGGRLTLVGLIVGVAAAAALARWLSTQLHGVGAYDAQVFVGVVLVLAAAAILASWLPARRAAGIDPMTALREE